MTMHSITKGLALVASRLTAFVAGCIFVACAAAVLFKDVVLHGAPITLDHLLTAGVLSGTLLVGKLLMVAWKGRHWLAIGGFTVLFAVGTVLIVYQSSGKQAEDTFQSQANADFAETERARTAPLLEKAQAMLDGTAKKLTDDCVEGKKGKTHCDGLRTSLAVYTAAVDGHNAKLDKLGPPRTVAPEAENFANLAEVFGANKDMVKAGAVLVVPFIRTMLFELGALWCFGFAFRPLPRSVSKPATQEADTKADTKAEEPRQPLSPAEQSDFGGNGVDEARQLGIGGEPGAGNWGNSGNGGGSKPPKGGNGGKRILSRGEAMLDVTRRLASGETVDAYQMLADEWGVNKSTVSKWMKRWREDGLAPSAQRVGRCHRLVAAV